MNKRLLKKAQKHLSKDLVIKKLIKTHGLLDFGFGGDPFEELVYSIIGQQLSDKAAATIYKRVIETIKSNPPTPSAILAVDDEKLRGCGISYSKISYIKGLSRAVKEKKLILEKLLEMEDEEVITELIKLKGIGRWTAEMFLIFNLKRVDVFSMGDLGLRTAVAKLYGVSRDDIKTIEKISLSWKPYRSIAARYLWKSLA